jgi:hypothetical protein
MRDFSEELQILQGRAISITFLDFSELSKQTRSGRDSRRDHCLLPRPPGASQGAEDRAVRPLPKTSTGKIQKFVLRERAKENI